MSSIYFIRHGQSQWNVENKICGSTDIPLTDQGREQAKLTAEEILKQNIQADRILYSPLSRAKETALIISKIIGLPAYEEPLLIEQNFGMYEGQPRDLPEFKVARTQFVNNYNGGESMMRLAQRIYNLIDRLKAENKNVILVAHNGISRVVNSYFYEMTNEAYGGFGIKNCEVKEYKFN